MKVLFALLMIVTAVTASAQSRPGRNDRDGRIILRDGNTTVRIGINDRSDTAIRIRLLEEAVRDLQAQVYDLRDEPRTQVVTMHVCTMNTTFNGSFIGKASSKIEAESITRNNCQRHGRESFCSSNRVTCERVDEVVNY